MGNCSDDPAATNVAAGDGTALTVTVSHQSARSEKWDVAIPAAAMGRYPELLGSSLSFDGIDRAYAQGDAFSYGGSMIGLLIQNRTSEQVVVDDIRPVNTRTVCIPTGLLVLYGSQGGTYIDLVYDLDAARPIGHEQTPEGEIKQGWYFSQHTIPVAANDSTGVEMTLHAAKRAYTFDFAIEYISKGQKYTQIVHPNAGQFKVTASTCPDSDMRKVLSDADVARLRGHRFQQIRRRADTTTADGQFFVSPVDPQAYVGQCPTL